MDSGIQINVPIDVFLKCYHHLLPSQLFVNQNGQLIDRADIIESKVDQLTKEPDIDFLWGGRDSGKTRHIAMRLLIDCLTLPYFRCVLVRKVFNTIKDSQFQQLKDIAKEWGIDEFFTFKESPLEIICENGNKFICRGMDDPSKLKSVSNPSHCWAEEMNQLDKDDFIVIMTSLRYNGGRVKTWCSFNPECDGDYQDFWLYKMFFDKEQDMYRTFVGKWEHTIPATMGPLGYNIFKERKVYFTYRCTWTTYRDNRYVGPERIAFLEGSAKEDDYYGTVFTNGKWGNRKVGDPFCYCYDDAKHKGKATLNYALELGLSFDFNVNPITCGVYQYDENTNTIHCIESIKMANSNIYELCGYIKVKYDGYLILVTGDATGRNTNAMVKDAINYYTIIKQELGLMDGQMKEPTINPDITENRVLVNSVLKKLNVIMDENNCKDLIFDCKNVSVDQHGKIDKGDRSNPKKRADHLDNFRYYLNTFFKWVLKLQ